ncbi:isocitrate lyase/PEP mutase family protein [Dawidia soli]|uniref:Isocitrate lyase/PEP mutase family protein n=1 Tax=Dawidia soli TaxID=2782352 RepID=A0AAP2DBQ8_9BACT|nr:isocitrate lyase/phosphoenolpyruvate mutase family protein [Dawidia soli]MBT1687720.1 isocitrate lyase/PEP mutase family protein [Dawidia soli]
MPFLEGITFTGKLADLSAYRMRGFDKIIVRRKGGPRPEHIHKSENFANVRRTMSEFGGCSRMGRHVRLALHQLRNLSDYNFGSDINSLMRQVQLQDGTGEWGKRNIILSEHARILEGFPLNEINPTFDSVIRNPLYYTIDRATRTAQVDIPALQRSINYFPQNSHAMFRVVVTLGIVPDMIFNIQKKEYLPPAWYSPKFYSREVSTEWFPSLEGMPASTLTIATDALPPDERWTLMLSVGIEYGAFRENGKIQEVKRYGAAKILALRGRDGLTEDILPGKETSNVNDLPGAEPVERNAPEEPTAAANTQTSHQTPKVTYVYTPAKRDADKVDVQTYTYAMDDDKKSVCSHFYNTNATFTFSFACILIYETKTIHPMSAFESFRQLHQNEKPLILGNTWDVHSARLFEQSGYAAVGTSSHAVAQVLGYDDGENVSFDDLLRLARRTAEVVKIPVTVDLEAGYARTADGIVENIKKLHDAGVAGINIEDTLPNTATLRPAEEFQKQLSAITNKMAQQNIKLFINTRTDGFILGLETALEETTTRARLYEQTGVHGLFVPCMTEEKDIRTVTSTTKLPVSVMCMPGLPAFDVLASWGLKRVSMGPFAYRYVNKQAEAAMKEVLNVNSFTPFF